MKITWTLAALVLYLLLVQCVDAEKSKRQQETSVIDMIKVGLQTGKEVIDFLNDKQFVQFVGKLAKSASKFLGVVGPVVDIVLGVVFPEKDGSAEKEAAEMQALKAEFIEISNKLDKFPFEFQDVKNLIDWRAVQVTYSEEEKTIRSLSHVWTEFAKANDSSLIQSYSRNYKRKFSSGFRDAAYKLYDAFCNHKQLLAKNLIVAAEKYSKRDRKLVRAFMLGLTQLIFRGAELEIAYYNMIEDKPFANKKLKDWESRIENMASVMRDVDDKLKNVWHDQSGQDLDEFGGKNAGQTNKDFSKGLYNLLVKKYYWRKWFVIVYDPVKGTNEHIVSSTGGHHRYRWHRKNVVVASSEEKSNFNKNAAISVLNNLNGKLTTFEAKKWYVALAKDIKKQQITYAFTGIICDKCNVWFQSENSRTYYRKLDVMQKKCSEKVLFVCKTHVMKAVGHMRGYLFG